MMPPEPPHFDPTRAALGGRSCTWLHVADGDTLRVQGSTLITVEDRVRLLGIDAPERGEDGWGAPHGSTWPDSCVGMDWYSKE